MCFDLSDKKEMEWSISIGSCANMTWNLDIEGIVREPWEDFSGTRLLDDNNN